MAGISESMLGLNRSGIGPIAGASLNVEVQRSREEREEGCADKKWYVELQTSGNDAII